MVWSAPLLQQELRVQSLCGRLGRWESAVTPEWSRWEWPAPSEGIRSMHVTEREEEALTQTLHRLSRLVEWLWETVVISPCGGPLYISVSPHLRASLMLLLLLLVLLGLVMTRRL